MLGPGSARAAWIVAMLSWASGSSVEMVIVCPVFFTSTKAESSTEASTTVMLLAGTARSSSDSRVSGRRRVETRDRRAAAERDIGFFQFKESGLASPCERAQAGRFKKGS